MKKKLLLTLTVLLTAFGGNAWAQQEEIAYKDREWDPEQKCIRDPSVFITEYTDLASLNDGRDWPTMTDGSTFVAKKNANITFENQLAVVGTVKLILCNGATVTCKQGLKVSGSPDDKAVLHIYSYIGDEGKLIVTNSNSGEAGIGSHDDHPCGSIYIHGGTIEATGGNGGAGIGSGRNQNQDGEICIYGGYVTAKGGNDAAGIGGGEEGSAGTINIYGGEITATGVHYGAGIGGGEHHGIASNGSVNIYGEKVTATGGTYAPGNAVSGGAGIGGGAWASQGGPINIYRGEVYADSGVFAAAIGGGDEGANGEINISGGYVEAKAHYDISLALTRQAGGAGIGSGDKNSTANGKITISGGEVKASGTYYGAGIGSGDESKVAHGEILITGGNITAEGGLYAAGIGTGDASETSAGTITITGGTVSAQGGEGGAGIGGGRKISGGTITISGNARVSPCGGTDGAGIGGGNEGNGGNVTISENAFVFITGEGKAAGIGGGTEGKGGTVSIKSGEVRIHIEGTDGEYGSPIGCGSGLNKDSESDTGTLEIANDMWVTEAGAPLGKKADERIHSCRNFPIVFIKKCEHPTLEYICSSNGHTPKCEYCLIGSTGEEPHTFEDFVCTACGYEQKDYILYDNEDNTALMEEAKAHAFDVTLSGRTLHKGGLWNTLCLPFPIDNTTGTIFEGATIKTLESATLDDQMLTVNFTNGSLTQMEAGKPYIVRWESGENITDPIFTAAVISLSEPASQETTLADGSKLTFCGLFIPTSYQEEDKSILYIGSDGKLHYADATTTINAFRAYFKLETVEGEAAPVKAFKLNFEGNQPTAIDFARHDDSTVEDNAWYDLSGRRLNSKPTAKGVYIRDGKKIAIQ